MKYAPCPKIKDKEARGLAQLLLQVDPKKRTTLQEALRHPWFRLANSLHEQPTLDGDICMNHAKKGKNFKLRAVLLQFVEAKMQGEDIEYYRQLWDQVDENSDGVLDISEFATMWNSVEYPEGRTKPSAQDIFDSVDSDKSGDIQFNEFVAFTFDPSRLDPETRRQMLQAAFCSIAGDDTLVQLDELEAIFSQEVKPLVKILFDEIDTDDSGSIDFPHFSDYILHLCDHSTSKSFTSKSFT